MELLAARDEVKLSRLRSREFENALILAAHRESIPVGAPIVYHTVHAHEFVAGDMRWAQCMGARAGLIAAHCGMRGAQGVFLNTWAKKVEIWIDSTPVGVAQLHYQLGISKPTIERFCNERGVPPHIVVPFFDRIRTDQFVNPANTFPFTPDCEDTFQKMLRLAN